MLIFFPLLIRSVADTAYSPNQQERSREKSLRCRKLGFLADPLEGFGVPTIFLHWVVPPVCRIGVRPRHSSIRIRLCHLVPRFDPLLVPGNSLSVRYQLTTHNSPPGLVFCLRMAAS